MKRFFILLTLVVLAIGCGGGDSADKSKNDGPVVQDMNVKIPPRTAD